MQIYEFRLNFHGSLFASVQLTIYTSVGSENGLVPASDKPLSFCTLCLDQSVHLWNRTVTSLDMWILHWRRSHRRFKSPVTQLDCLFNLLFRQTSTPAFLPLCEGNPLVTDGFPSQKASNAASVGPMLVQRWHTTIGVTLCQRWPHISVPTLGRCWHNVGPTLARHRWANWQFHVGPTLVSRRWPNVRVDVGPTLGQRRNASWDFNKNPDVVVPNAQKITSMQSEKNTIH